MYLERKGPSFIEHYADIAKKLQAAGATHILICCNTAHYAIDLIQRKSNVDIVSLIRETATSLRTNYGEFSSIGILCTAGTRKVGLYDECFDDVYPAASIIYPDEGFQQEVSAGIGQVKDRSDMFAANKSFHEAIGNLKDKGSTMILIACTDISLALNKRDFDIPYLDTTDVLVSTVLRIWRENVELEFPIKEDAGH